jgi:hypothetical protein
MQPYINYIKLKNIHNLIIKLINLHFLPKKLIYEALNFNSCIT